MQISRDSLRRFIRFFLGINETKFGYHQTLTFNRDISEPDAKKFITRLFKNLIRKFPEIGIVYIQQRQPGTGRIHFHVRLHFYIQDGLPFANSLMKKRLSSIVFREWQSLIPGTLARRANELNNHPKDLTYLLREVDAVKWDQKTPRPKTNWWGCANKKVLLRHFTEPSRADIDKALQSHLNRVKEEPSLQYQRNHYRTMGWLRKERELYQWGAENAGWPSWETYKKIATGRKVKVTDKEFLEWENGQNP